MARIIVTPEELETASQAIAGLSEEYTSIYTQLLQQANTMGEAYKGEENIAFVNKINGLCDHLRAMANKLKDGSDTLYQQAGQYIGRRDFNKQQINNLPG